MDFPRGLRGGVMGGTAEDRLRWKEPLHSFEVELQREFGLSVVETVYAGLKRYGLIYL
jgi:hypothetical protein